MISLRNLTLRRGARLLLENADLTIHAGEKVGLIGPNGCGKSSLFALLRDEIHPDGGDLEMPRQAVVAHVAQEMDATDQTAINYILDGDAELRQLEGQLAQAEKSHDAHAIGDLHARLAAIDGYGAKARAAKLMSGLGFAHADAGRPVCEFSGGWRVRLNLARALLCRSDILLLDEPTNHLDLDAVIWLEGWLRNYPGTLIMVSHDRDFLDSVVNRVARIDRCRLRAYAGNYTAYEKARAEELAQEQAAYEKQQREIAHMEDFIRRFRAKATKARQAQSRIKALERLERASAAHVDSPFTFAFREPVTCGSPLLRLEEGRLGYGEKAILSGVNLTLLPGQRIGLLGHNGAGKSTLVKTLAGEVLPLSGKRIEARNLAIGYFAQHQTEALRAEESPLWHMGRLAPDLREQDLRDYLGGFGFHGDLALSPTGPFSGGEKARLALALLIWQRPNLLLLDEPTNHLDLEMRHALTLALQDYAGTVVIVSHDRHLLRTCCDDFLLVDSGACLPFAGDLDDYAKWATAPRDVEPSKEAKNDNVDRKQQKRQEAEARQALSAKRKPLEQEIQHIEKTMQPLNEEKQRLDALLAEGGIYAEARKAELLEAMKRQSEVAAKLAQLEERWLVIHEELDNFISP